MLSTRKSSSGGNVHVEIPGLDKLRADLSEMGDVAQIRVIKGTMKRAAQIALVEARARTDARTTPSYTKQAVRGHKGGLRAAYGAKSSLRSSWRTYVTTTTANLTNRAYNPSGKGAYYASFVEYGSVHNEAKHLATGAVEDKADEIMEYLGIEFDKMAAYYGWK